MSLEFDQGSDPGKFMSPHVLHARTDGQEMFVLSGVVVIDLKGTTSDKWRWETVKIVPKLPLPVGQMLVVDQVAPFVSLNSVLNLGHSVNSGFAVDAFHLSGSGKKLYGGVPVEVECAVRDSDAWLYRLGYTITLTGKFEPTDLDFD